MNKREEKAFGEAYDKLYDLNSVFRYAFEYLIDGMEAEAKKRGYHFVLVRDKWKCKRLKEVTKND